MKLTAPHWVIVALVLLGTLSPQLAVQFKDVSWLVAICNVITQIDPLVLGVFGVTTASAVNSTNVAAVAKVTAVKAAGAAMLLMLALMVVLLGGCLSSAPTVPVTPANQGQVNVCQNTAALHNGVVISDFVLGGTSAGLASAAAAFSDQNTKTTLAVAGASVAGALIIGTALAELTASNFANSQCAAVVGALPTAPTPAGH